MNKSKKIYIRALDKYNNGYIDKAIELCEESISIDIKNAPSINLKGLLCYLKGDLDGAQRLWKMNKQMNKDAISERYLEDTKLDTERLKLYKVSLEFIRELKIQEALNLLQKCAESDFNYINVNSNLALCYIKEGQYDKAVKYIEKVFSVDKQNTMAKEIRKKLQSYGIIKNKSIFKKIASTIIIIVCLITFIISSLFIIKSARSKQYPKIINMLKG